jgi:hypothetical protein
MAEATKVASWRIILDLLTTFLIFGYVIGLVFGGATDAGFQLQGGPALLLLVAIVAYFLIFNRFLGGTIWKRILGAAR